MLFCPVLHVLYDTYFILLCCTAQYRTFLYLTLPYFGGGTQAADYLAIVAAIRDAVVQGKVSNKVQAKAARTKLLSK